MVDTMRVAICEQPNHLCIQNRPIPSVGDQQVLVRVSCCGICGSDLAAWRGSGHKQYPYSPGHEFCGVIEQLGSEVTDLEAGQRVVIDPNLGCGECSYCSKGRPNLCDHLKTRAIKSSGGFSDFVALDYRMVHVLPAELSDDLAVFVEPLSCSLHAAQLARRSSAERVTVFGAGIMGLLTAWVLRSWQIDVVIVEPSAVRRENAQKLIEVAAKSPESWTQQQKQSPFDTVIDCSGSVAAVNQILNELPKAGQLILAGLILNARKDPIDLIPVTTKELTLTGVWLNPNTFGQAIDLALRQQHVLERFDTVTFALADVEAAFAKAQESTVHRVLVKP